VSILFWLVVSFALSVLLAVLLTPIVIRAAGSLRLLDSPDGGRRNHEQPVPRVGGIAVYLAAATIALAIFARTSPLFVIPGAEGEEQIRFLTGVFLGSALLFITGVVDDVRELSAGIKGLAQIIAAGLAWYFGARLDFLALGYGAGVPLGILGFPLLMIWIVGVTNAFNFVDGLNGLAAGLGIVALATLFIAGIALGNSIVLIPTIALAGALLGFLKFNFPKARIFLGDSGSMSVGYCLAVLSLKAAENDHGAVLFAVPLLALSVPLMDGNLAILRRWLRHIPISGADARHIHHRLQALGVTPSRAAIILWTLAAVMAGFGLLMALTAPFVASSIAILALVGVAVMLIYGTNLLSYHELIVAGEVLLSAPSRARRVISDEIRARDLVSSLHEATTVDDLASLLSESATSFGFVGMELIGEGVTSDKVADRILPAHWAWRLDYPIRLSRSSSADFYVLSIWCSPESGTRPYGAERIARVLGPSLQQWFEGRGDRPSVSRVVRTRAFAAGRKK
jgi:UDP-GlcNAc:undecaprenyl-phosphate GlcNAc-1-phosphate transferase